MKRNIVASVLGVVACVASVASSYGQGSVWFQNYNNTPNAPIQYAASEAKAGQYIGAPFRVDLLYQFGASALTPVATTSLFSVDSPNQATGSGFFNGSIVTIPGYVSGAINFTVQAYNGADYASSVIIGSQTFQVPGIATGTTLPSGFGPTFTAFTVATVPEPSTLALIGLGTGALLFLRRRK